MVTMATITLVTINLVTMATITLVTIVTTKYMILSAAVSFRLLPYQKPAKKKVHAAFHFAASICIIAGLVRNMQEILIPDWMIITSCVT